MSHAADVVIAGAGPAGCAAALGCARRGLGVLLVDRARFPRDKACGEGLLPSGVAALARLGLLAEARRIGWPIAGVGFALDDDGDGPLAEADFPRVVDPPYGLGLPRRQLDALLVATARAEPNVTVLEGVSAGQPIVENGVVVGLWSEQGPLRARVVVAADGLRSRLRAALGLSLPARDDDGRMGLRVHLAVPRLPLGARVRVLVGPRFEHYVTPVGAGALQVALLGPRSAFAAAGLSASRYVEHLRAHPRLGPLLADATPLDRPLGAGPFRQRVRSVVADGALLVGDAAGYIDAITGEGMGAALRQGLAAADTIADALATRPRGALPAAALQPYARAHAAIVRNGNRLTELVLLLARHPFWARRAIALLAAHPWLLGQLLRVQAGAPPPSWREVWAHFAGAEKEKAREPRRRGGRHDSRARENHAGTAAEGGPSQFPRLQRNRAGTTAEGGPT